MFVRSFIHIKIVCSPLVAVCLSLTEGKAKQRVMFTVSFSMAISTAKSKTIHTHRLTKLVRNRQHDDDEVYLIKTSILRFVTRNTNRTEEDKASFPLTRTRFNNDTALIISAYKNTNRCWFGPEDGAMKTDGTIKEHTLN